MKTLWTITNGPWAFCKNTYNYDFTTTVLLSGISYLIRTNLYLKLCFIYLFPSTRIRTRKQLKVSSKNSKA